MPYHIVAAGVLAAASAVTGVVAANEQKDAVKFQKKAQRQQTGIEIERNRKAAVQTMREARIRSAIIAQSSQNAGAKGSGAAGARGSIASQAGGSIGFQQTQQQAAMNTSQFLSSAADAQSKAGAWGAASDVFGKGSQFFGSLG